MHVARLVNEIDPRLRELCLSYQCVEHSAVEIRPLLFDEEAVCVLRSRIWNPLLVTWERKGLPAAHAPNVNMHKVRAAIGPHSSATQAQCRVTQLRRRNPT